MSNMSFDKKYLIVVAVLMFLVVIFVFKWQERFTPFNPQKDTLFTSGQSMRVLAQEPTDSSMGSPETVLNAQWPEGKGIDPLKYIQI